MALDAIDAGRRNIQLAMAQGTGKTYVAREIIWKLLRSGRSRRVLCISTRRAIAEQTFSQFKEISAYYDVALLPQPESAYRAAVQVATTAAFLLPNRSRLDGLPTDHYDLIVVADLRDQPEGWRKIAQHFSSARVIGFSTDLYFDTDFSESVFQYTIDEALAAESIRELEGFRMIRLGNIADITVGTNPASNVVARSLPLISARSLPADGTWTAATSELETTGQPDPVTQWSIKNALHPKDILVAGILNPRQPRITMVPATVTEPLYIHSSVYRIRITDSTIAPEDVFAFLRSDAGMRSIERFASVLGGHLRITARDLAQMPIFVPEISPPNAPLVEPTERPTAEQSLSATAQALREITEIVVPELEALERQPQMHDPRFVAARLRDIATRLASPPLAERVMARYPMPIALAYRRFHDSRFNVYEQVLRLRDLFESAAFFIYNITLADALRRLSPEKYAVADRGARTAYDGFSMAARISFVEAVAAMARSHTPTDLFLPELCNSSFGSHARQLQSDFRNHISHSATASESRQRAILTRYQPVVESMLGELSFLEDYRLARIASLYMRDGKYVRRIELYQGVTPVIDEQPFEPNQQPDLAEFDHLVLLDENDDHLDLYPMYQFVANEQTGDDTHMCCLKQRRGKELLGESVQAPIDVTLDGSVHFETLRSRLKDKA
jgi:type I restriction enzyme R subunit